jgi:hypothetical protein
MRGLNVALAAVLFLAASPDVISASPSGLPPYYWVIGVFPNHGGGHVPGEGYLREDDADTVAAASREVIAQHPPQYILETVQVVYAADPGTAAILPGALPDDDSGHAIAENIDVGCNIATGSAT